MCNVARSDVPGDSCVAFAADAASSGVTHKSPSVLRDAQALTVCATSREITRVFGRTSPKKSNNELSCSLYENVIKIGANGENAGTASDAQERRPAMPTLYMASIDESGKCPVPSDDRYVIVNDVGVEVFQRIMSWWTCIQRYPAHLPGCNAEEFKGVIALRLRSAIRDGSAHLQGIARDILSTENHVTTSQYTLRFVVEVEGVRLYLLRVTVEKGSVRLTNVPEAIL